MPRRQSHRERRQKFTGGLYRKTGYYIEAGTGEKVAYTYWQAAREVQPEHLPRGVERKRITGNGRTEREALARLEENWLAYHSGDGAPRTRRRRSQPVLTVEGLYALWQRENELGAVSDQMAYKYEGYFRNHITPHIGGRKLDDLTERDLRLLFSDVLPSKRRASADGTLGDPLLSGAAIRNIYMALSGCLNYGVRNGYLDRSPLKAIAVPRKQPPNDDIEAASVNARALLARLSADDPADYARWLFQFLGLRRAERLGLAWSNVRGLDTENPQLVVRQQLARYANGEGWYVKPQTKTNSIRTIAIPEPFLSALRAHKRQQDDQRRSAEWNPSPEFADLVFLQPSGAIYTLNRDNEEWHRLLERYQLPYWRGHLNRHITATWLAEMQPPVPIGTVQSILGHDTEAMTIYYAKSTQQQQAAPMRQYGERIAASGDKPRAG